MEKNMNQERVDQLIKQFWRYGYLTVKRKYGTYLPAPELIGDYEVDAIGKQVDRFAIGITLSDNDIADPNIIEKIAFLATRHTRFTKKNVLLIVGVPKAALRKTKLLLTGLDPEIKKNIKIVSFPLSQTIN